MRDILLEAGNDHIESAPTVLRIAHLEDTERNADAEAEMMTARTQGTETGEDRNPDPAVPPTQQNHSSASKAHYRIKKMHSANKWP
jgi:hypothetical protein